MTLIRPLCAHGHELGCTPPDFCPKCLEEARKKADADSPFIRILRSVGGVQDVEEEMSSASVVQEYTANDKENKQCADMMLHRFRDVHCAPITRTSEKMGTANW